MVSTFKLGGTYPDGYWWEEPGAIRLKLAVEVRERGWYWRPRTVRSQFLASSFHRV
jgi:hypothetical protein